MKLKYYLRGLGIGIIITTIVLTISYSGRKLELTDEEIIQRAEELGMVMEEDSLFPFRNKESDTEQQTESDSMTDVTQQPETEILVNSEQEAETEQPEAEHSEAEEQIEADKETNADVETYRLTIFPGFGAQNIGNELEKNGVIEDGYMLSTYLTQIGYSKLLNVGEYDIPYGASNEEIYEILKDGPL